MSQTRRTLIAGAALALLGLMAIAPLPLAAQQLKEVRIGFQRAGLFPAVKQRRTVEDALKPRGIDVKWVEFSFGPPLLFPAFAAVFFGSTQFKNRPNVWGTIAAVYTLAFGVKGLQLAFSGGVYWITPLFNGLALLVAVALASRKSIPRLRPKAVADAEAEADAAPDAPAPALDQPPRSTIGTPGGNP